MSRKINSVTVSGLQTSMKMSNYFLHYELIAHETMWLEHSWTLFRHWSKTKGFWIEINIPNITFTFFRQNHFVWKRSGVTLIMRPFVFAILRFSCPLLCDNWSNKIKKKSLHILTSTFECPNLSFCNMSLSHIMVTLQNAAHPDCTGLTLSPVFRSLAAVFVQCHTKQQ